MILPRREFLRLSTAATALAVTGFPRSARAGAAGLGDSIDFSQWLQPVPPGAVFEHPDWCIWCGSAVRGDDGKYHLFYSRWPSKLGHLAWVTHSEVARDSVRDRLRAADHVEMARHRLRIVFNGGAAAAGECRDDHEETRQSHRSNAPCVRKAAVCEHTGPDSNMPEWLTGSTM
jgi:hypothetical protein